MASLLTLTLWINYEGYCLADPSHGSQLSQQRLKWPKTLCSMLCRADQNGWVTVRSWQHTAWWGGNRSPLQRSGLENTTRSVKRERHYARRWAPGHKASSMLLSRSREQSLIVPEEQAAGPKQKRCSLVDTSGGEGKVGGCILSSCLFNLYTDIRWNAELDES